MNFIAHIQGYLFVIAAAFLIAAICMGGILFYLLKVKKVMAKDEKINYSHFNRSDILNYLRFDDIIECGSDGNGFGVICRNNVYTAGIDICGYNFAEASSEMRESTMRKAIAFCDIIKDDVQLRQSVTSINLSDNLSEHQEILKEYDKELIGLDDEYQKTLRMIDDLIDDPNVEIYLDRADAIKKKIDTIKWLSDETQALIEWMNIVTKQKGESSGTDTDSQRTNQMLFSYIYNENDFTNKPSPEEIKIRAVQELKTKAATYINALEKCGCKCHPLSADEMALSIYDYMHPFNTQSATFKNMFENALHQLYTSSDSLEELSRAREGEREFEQKMANYAKEYEENLQKSSLEFQRVLREEFKGSGLDIG